MSNDKKIYTTLGNFIYTNYLDKNKANYTTISELSIRLDISRQLLYLVMTGKQKLSTALARRMSEVFGRNPSFYLSLDREDIIEFDEISYDNFNKKELISYWLQMGGRTLVNKDVLKATQFDIINIKPFNLDCLKLNSYECVISTSILEITEQHNAEFDSDNIIRLLPNAMISVTSEQYIKLPNYIFARVNPLQHDYLLITTNPNLSPGYRGRISANIINISDSPQKIFPFSPIVSLEFCFLPVSPVFTDLVQQKNKTRDELTSNFTDIKMGAN